MIAYYNENDPKAAAWLRELIKAKLITNGVVDERSIEDIYANDLKGYSQHHFFAGIGGWSHALRLAGWPDDRPVWTGSCPCQPFSSAGKRKGTSDERHLWPAWQWLIRWHHPDVVFGEQVASKDGLSWLDLVSTDLEHEGYTFAPTVLPACGVGSPHIRQRLWFVAHSNGGNSRAEREQRSGQQRLEPQDGIPGIMAHGESLGRVERRTQSGGLGSIGHSQLGDSGESKVGRHTGTVPESQQGGTYGFWRDPEWIYCRDKKYRPIKPGTFPLAHGVSARVAKLRGIGNAIVPQVAAQIIGAYMELTSDNACRI